MSSPAVGPVIALGLPGSAADAGRTSRTAGPILEAACWVHARRPFFHLAENARRKVQYPICREKVGAERPLHSKPNGSYRTTDLQIRRHPEGSR